VRLAVLPFRMTRPDQEVDYLAVSLADAVASSLSGLESLVVRSTLKSARYAGAQADLDALAAELAVDMVLTGSILRIGDRLRVGAELVSVPAGDVVWSQTTQVPLESVFELHDELAQRVIGSLPLTTGDRSRAPLVRPSSAKAFDLYLRGMQLRMETSSWRQARSFFDSCLDLDPTFAPAWAERGRLDRVLSKYEDPRALADAEAALQRALELDPDSGAALHHYAQLEIDLGRVEAALGRLLDRARQRRAEPQIYAALVHACRYAGLLDASIAAHQQARRFDPAVPTSVLHTYYMQGDYARALEESHHSSDPIEARALGAMGRETEAVAAARREEQRFSSVVLLRSFTTAARAAFEGHREEALAALHQFSSTAFSDGERWFYVAEIWGRLAVLDQAFATLDRAVAAGFACVPAFERDPYLALLRSDARWPALLGRARSRQENMVEAFLASGGPTLLGL
jgi:TolB-like protein